MFEMKCPHCEAEIPGVACPRCGQTIPEGANYCMDCGAPMREDVTPPEEEMGYEYEDDGELDLENRVLCPDGTCTGIIVDGRCTECGRREEEIRNGVEEPEDAAEAQERTEEMKEKTGDSQGEG